MSLELGLQHISLLCKFVVENELTGSSDTEYCTFVTTQANSADEIFTKNKDFYIKLFTTFKGLHNIHIQYLCKSMFGQISVEDKNEKYDAIQKVYELFTSIRDFTQTSTNLNVEFIQDNGKHKILLTN